MSVTILHWSVNINYIISPISIPLPYQTILKDESRRKRQEEVRGCKRKYEEVLEEGRGPRIPWCKGPKVQGSQGLRYISHIQIWAWLLTYFFFNFSRSSRYSYQAISNLSSSSVFCLRKYHYNSFHFHLDCRYIHKVNPEKNDAHYHIWS